MYIYIYIYIYIYANWPTVDRFIKVDSDYNWSPRTNYTRWNSDNVITQLTVNRFIYQDAMDERGMDWLADGRAGGRTDEQQVLKF